MSSLASPTYSFTEKDLDPIIQGKVKQFDYQITATSSIGKWSYQLDITINEKKKHISKLNMKTGPDEMTSWVNEISSSKVKELVIGLKETGFLDLPENGSVAMDKQPFMMVSILVKGKEKSVYMSPSDLKLKKYKALIDFVEKKLIPTLKVGKPKRGQPFTGLESSPDSKKKGKAQKGK